MESYAFPSQKLKPAAEIPADKVPCIIATCGSYNPITLAHVDMFEGAKKQFELKSASGELLGGKGVFAGAFLSPVNDAYKKAGLASFPHRRKVCELALSEHPWLSVDPWEGLQEAYVRSFVVLSHIRDECEKVYGRPCQLFFLCGGDLFETFYKPGCWELTLLEKIFQQFNLIVVARANSMDPLELMRQQTAPLTSEKDPGFSVDLRKYEDKVTVIAMLDGEVSSTMVRKKLVAGEDASSLVHPKALEYILEQKLWMS